MNVLKPLSKALKLTCCSVICVLPISGFTQSLDEAIAQQLSSGPGTLPCSELNDGFEDNNDRYTGGLLDICSTVVPVGTASSSAGGGAGTPTSLPTTVDNLVQDAHNEQANGNESDSDVASAKINNIL